MHFLQRYGFYGLDLIAGLSINPEEGTSFLIICHNRKGRLLGIETRAFASLSGLSDWLGKHPGVPVALYVDLPQKAEAAIPVEAPDPVAAVMGVKVEQSGSFCWQSWLCGEGRLWVCLVRKEALRLLLDEIPGLKSRLTGLCLSQAAEASLLSILPDYQEAAAYCYEDRYGWQGGLQEGKIPHALPKGREEVADALGVLAVYVGPYVAALEVAKGTPAPLGEITQNALQFERSGKQKRLLGWTLLLLLLLHAACRGGLLWIETRIASLSEQLKAEQPLLEKLTENERTILEKQRFWTHSTQAGLQKGHVSFYLDRLAAACPEDLRFTTLTVFPKEKETQKSAHAPPLLLQGRAARSGAVSQLARAVQALPAFQKAEILGSEYRIPEEDYAFSMGIFFPDSL